MKIPGPKQKRPSCCLEESGEEEVLTETGAHSPSFRAFWPVILRNQFFHVSVKSCVSLQETEKLVF